MKKYVFKPYNTSFPELFQKEKERLSHYLKNVLAIEHIGSTAVPGLGGKGIIDIALAADKEKFAAITLQLESLGYEFKPAIGTSERLFFLISLPDPDEEARVYHLHLTYPENDEWKRFIEFRDFLRRHPAEMLDYAELKKRAALEANQNGEKYRKIKEPIFTRVRTASPDTSG